MKSSLPLLLLLLIPTLSHSNPLCTRKALYSALRCGCHLTAPIQPHLCRTLRPHSDPCRPYKTTTRLIIVLRAMHHCTSFPSNSTPVTRMQYEPLKTLSPQEVAAITERARAMIEHILEMLNMRASVKPRVRMVAGDEAIGVRKRRLMKYNGIDF